MPPMPQAAGMPGEMGAPSVEAPITPEQRQELLNLIAQIKQKLASFQALKFASKNKTDQFRVELLNQVFEKLQLAGVDLTDQASVAAFMQNLKDNNPELAQMFEEAMEALLGGPDTSGEETGEMAAPMMGMPTMNNQNPNENLPEGLRANIPQA